MTDQPFRRLLALVDLDQSIAKYCTESKLLKQDLDQEEKKYNVLIIKKEEYNNRILKARKEIDMAELELQTLNQKEVFKKKKLEETSNLKEYNAAKAELALVHIDLQKQEEIVLSAWNHLELLEEEAKKYEKSLPELEIIYQQHRAAKEIMLTVLLNKIQSLEQNRPTLLTEMPEEWLSQYTVMRAQIVDPVVPLIDDSCSRCFSPAPSQLCARINRGALLPCKGCYRLLYNPVLYNVDAR
jgi:predicted  nucleic acid-binding Zn-ribbon protein